MKKALLGLAGTAALVSILTVSAATPFTPQTGTRNDITEKGRKGKKGIFDDSTDTEKAELKALMAEDLAGVIGQTKETVLVQLEAGKTPHEIILASGYDVGKVEASLLALQKTRMETVIQQEVVAGTLTQEKADTLLQKLAKREKEIDDRKEKTTQDIAYILGTTVDDVKHSLESGKSADTFAEEKGVSASVLESKLAAKKKEELAGELALRVASGKLTQREADSILTKRSGAFLATREW